MKYRLLFVWLFASFVLQAQEKQKPTTEFVINGAVKHTVRFALKDAKSFQQHSLDSLVIYNHLLERKRTMYGIKGILLKDILEQAGISQEKPKLLSEYFFTCIASDGYKVIFSWNELFNTDIGSRVMVITEADGKKAQELDDPIAIISPMDKATGRRYVKNLQQVKVERVQ